MGHTESFLDFAADLEMESKRAPGSWNSKRRRSTRDSSDDAVWGEKRQIAVWRREYVPELEGRAVAWTGGCRRGRSGGAIGRMEAIAAVGKKSGVGELVEIGRAREDAASILPPPFGIAAIVKLGFDSGESLKKELAIDGYRMGGCLIVYRPETTPLQVVSILHSRRDVEELLRERR